MPRLTGKVAIITGAARGQGAEHARRFVEEGARVVLGDVLADEVRAVAHELGDAAADVVLDVTDAQSWQSANAFCLERFGRVDVLLNNAGVLGVGRLAEIDVAEFRRTLEVNLIGPWLGINTVGAQMVSQGSGSIINVASIAGHRATVGRGSYTASKWGLRGLTKSAALELGPSGVRVNTILPGYIDTEMLGERQQEMRSSPSMFSGLALQRIGESSDIASLALFLASDESAYCTGADFVVDGGASLGYYVPSSNS